MNVSNFANDTTHFVCHKSLRELLEKLERNSELAIHWLEDNYIKLHTGNVVYLYLVLNMNTRESK